MPGFLAEILMNNDSDNADDRDALKALTVLYVEDEASAREELAGFLQRHVARIHTAASGEAGLEVFAQQRPDLVITDIRMPGMDSLDLAERIRAISPKTPIILITAFEEVRYFQRAIHLGVDQYVTKPVNLDRLMSGLRKCAHTLHLEAALRASEAFTFSVLNSLTEEVAVLDAQGVIVYVNAAWQRFAEDNGAPDFAQRSVGLSYRAICLAAAGQPGGETALTAWAGIEAVLTGARNLYVLEYPCNSPEELRWFRMSVYPLVAPLSGVVIAHENITTRKHLENALRASLSVVQYHHVQMRLLNQMNTLLLSCETRKEAYEVIARSMKDLFAGDSGGLAMVENSGPELRVAATWGNHPILSTTFQRNDCWALQHGEPYDLTDPAIDLPCRHFVTPPKSPSLCVPLIVRGETFGLLQISATSEKAEELFPDWRALVIKASGSVKLVLSNLKLQETLREQAIHDALTGLFNRRYLDETLPRELRRCQRTQDSLAVAMLDLDHFKGFNDTFGHEAGDIILRAIGEVVLRSSRAGDLGYRYGGEELVLVLPGATAAQAKSRLTHLRQAIEHLRLSYRGSELPPITISVGIAIAEPDEQEGTALLVRADTALYQAKAQGRNRVVVAS